MKKLSKLAHKALFKASDAFIKFVILPLFQWATDNKEAFFFIIIGDQYNTDVAWANSDKLICDGALAVSSNPLSAGVMCSIADCVQILTEDELKDPEYNKIYQDSSPSSDDHEWISIGDPFPNDHHPTTAIPPEILHPAAKEKPAAN